MARKPQPRFLRLDEIEAEGDAAGDETARNMLDDILRDGGRIDWSAVAKSGPTVARALLRHSIEVARRSLPMQADPPTQPRPAAQPTKPKVSMPRVWKNWRALQVKPKDDRWFSFFWGAGTATLVSLIGIVIVRLLNL